MWSLCVSTNLKEVNVVDEDDLARQDLPPECEECIDEHSEEIALGRWQCPFGHNPGLCHGG